MLEFSKPTEDLRGAVREWALARVRPLAREADRLHGPPRGALDVVSSCPVNFGQFESDPRAAAAIEADGSGVLSSLVMEELAFGDHWPLFTTNSSGIGQNVVALMGTPEQKARWVAPVRRGEINYTAFALTEPHFGSDPSQVATTARRDGDSWVLNGTKMYCSMGASADYVVVFATIDKAAGRHGIRAFVVEKGTPGVKVTKPNEDKLGIRCAETSEIRYENAVIPLSHCLGFSEEKVASAAEPGGERRQSGFLGALGALASSRPLMAAIALGIARGARQVAGDWARERREAFEPTRWARIEDDFQRMDHALEHALRMVVRSAWLKEQRRKNTREASAAKAFGPPIAERVIRRCVQLMGPDGTSEDYLVEKWYRDVKIFDIFEGSGQINRITVSRELMGHGAARG